jgi:hypothetical protein
MFTTFLLHNCLLGQLFYGLGIPRLIVVLQRICVMALYERSWEKIPEPTTEEWWKQDKLAS